MFPNPSDGAKKCSRLIAESRSLPLSKISSFRSLIIHQIVQQLDTEYHDQQADGDDDEQREAEPAEHHGGGADAALDRAVAQVLGDGAGGDGGGVLPQHRHQHEDARHEDEGERDLRHGPRGEGLDVALGSPLVDLLVPAGKGREQDEADEGEDDGDDAMASVSTTSEIQQSKRLGACTHMR